MARFKYFDIRHKFTDYPDAKYYIAIAARSNGKTNFSLDYAFERFVKNDKRFEYLLRKGELMGTIEVADDGAL